MKRFFAPLIIAALFLGQSLHSQIVISIRNVIQDDSSITSTAFASGSGRLELNSSGSATWGSTSGTTASANFSFSSSQGSGSISGSIYYSGNNFSGVSLDFGRSLAGTTLQNLTITGSSIPKNWTAMTSPMPDNLVNASWAPQNNPNANGAMGMAIQSTLTAIPEPSTYAAILGGLALCFIGYRRFRAAKV